MKINCYSFLLINVFPYTINYTNVYIFNEITFNISGTTGVQLYPNTSINIINDHYQKNNNVTFIYIVL